jgi:eukaryotic-like serine/threonine-protein kinase
MSTQPSADLAPTTLARGALIGRYVVLGLVGRGGMGEVYAAYDPELNRKVAVKLLRIRASNGITASEGRQRTLREAQAIARLSHPNVVTVFDVGTLDEQVFIAMQFVEGHNATYWAQSQPRGWKEVLEVYLAAGRGLAAAHDKGLVHRDFKPDNIMVGTNGDVRVMDFGLARQIVAPSATPPAPPPGAAAAAPGPAAAAAPGPAGVAGSDDTLAINRAAALPAPRPDSRPSGSPLFDARLTRTGAMMGTPAYMAPEQFYGQEVDARADQFSFCVSLYEALYGERPFAGKNMQELAANVFQGNVREPSPKTDVPIWIRRILLRGLRAAPTDRFLSMGDILDALATDPRAHRRKLAIYLSVVVPFVALAAIVVVRLATAEHRPLCEGADDRLAASWELASALPDGTEPPRRARIRKAFMDSGKSYAVDVFNSVNEALTSYARSWATMYRDSCVATNIRHEQSDEVLDLRSECLQERLNSLHALTEVFATANGAVVENAVSAVNQLPTLERCTNVPLLRAVIRPPNDPKTVAAVDALRVRLADLKARFDAGDWKDTLKQAPVLLAQARKLGYDPVTAEALVLKGTMDCNTNNAASAESALYEGYQLADACRHDEVRAEAATWLVFVTGNLEAKFDDAERWFKASSAVLKRLGHHDLLRAWLLNNMGCAYAVQHDENQSLSLLKSSLELKRGLLGPDHLDVAISEDNIAYVLSGSNRFMEAVPHVDSALSIYNFRLGPIHPALAHPLTNRGEILNGLGRYAEARKSFQQAIAIWQRELGPDAPVLAIGWTGLALSDLGEGKEKEAIQLLERANRVRSAHPVDPADQAETSFALARALWDAGRDRRRARRLAEQAKATYATGAAQNQTAAVDTWLQSHPSR